jgi:hypothetical protein
MRVVAVAAMRVKINPFFIEGASFCWGGFEMEPNNFRH